MAKVLFDGSVYSRSSRKDSGPPGEIEVLALNPQRRELILTQTGWAELVPGTLNLKIEDTALVPLDTIRPAFDEPPVTYPEKYAHIPEKRGGYVYYRARFKTADGKRARGLIRRCKNPLKGCVEAIAPVHLRDTLGVSDHDNVNVRVTGGIMRPADQFFFDHKGGHVGIESAYPGAHAFLICSGPSFNALDKAPLQFAYTMCVNNSAKACMPHFRPNLWTCMDSADKFLYTLWQDPTTTKLVPTSHRKKELWNSDRNAPVGRKVYKCPSVFYYERNNCFNVDTFLSEPTINWGSSSKVTDANGVRGKRSVNLAALKLLYVLGFRHVYLLGVDYHMDAETHYSFDQDRKKSAVKGNMATYKQNMWRFGELQPKFLKAKFHVYNCNPDSALKAFPYMPYEDALANALQYAHDWRAYIAGQLENTVGLYETKWYVCPDCGANQRVSKEQAKKDATCACGRRIAEECRRKYCKDPDGREATERA